MGIIENKVIAVDCPVTQADLDRASYSLNKKLRGRPFASLKSSVLNELKEEIKTEDSSFQQAVTLLLSSLDTREKERVYLDGIINILEHPEFKELEKFKLLLALMEEETGCTGSFRAIRVCGSRLAREPGRSSPRMQYHYRQLRNRWAGGRDHRGPGSDPYGLCPCRLGG